jgi:plasmid stability protein
VDARNITFKLPVDLIREAKIFAASHDTTVNALVRDLLHDRLSSHRRGHDSTGKPL